MQNIRIVFEEEVDLPRQLVDLWRTERSDNNCSESDYCEHGYDGNRWGWMRSGGRPGWVYDWSPDHPWSWGYVFDFDDDTRGICRVREVNPALRALGCRVDLLLEPAAPPPRPQSTADEFSRLLADAVRHQARHSTGTITWGTPVEDSIPAYTIDATWPTYRVEQATMRWTTLDEYGNPLGDERF